MQTHRKLSVQDAEDGLRRTAWLLILVVFLATGCNSSPWSSDKRPSRVSATPAAKASAAQVAPSPSQPAPAAPARSDRAADSRAVEALMAEIDRIQPLEPSARAKLAEDLAQTDPQLRPLVLQQFRASVAYRRQVEDREMLAAARQALPAEQTPGPAPPPARMAARPTPSPPSSPPLDPQAQRAADPGVEEQREPSAAGYSGVQDGPSSVERPAAADQPERSECPPPKTPPDSGAASQPPGAIQLASYVTGARASDDWQEHLAAAIRTLEAKPLGQARSAEEMAEHARLRLLYLLAQRRDDAVRPIPAAAPSLRDVQDFWSNQVYGLAVWLDSQRVPDTPRRAEEARRHLGAALTRLGEISPLVIRNLAFVTEVQSFGSYKQCKKYEFAPEEVVLLYAEVENLRSEQTPRGFHAAWKSSYQILDSRGQRVAEHEPASSEEYCQNSRRDFFIGCQLRLPKHIYPGKHTLQLTVEDLKTEKVGQSSIEFHVKGEGG